MAGTGKGKCLQGSGRSYYLSPKAEGYSFVHVRPSEQTNRYLGGSVWVSRVYFKWDLFCRHIKNGFVWLKMSLSGYFCMGKTHKYTNIRMSVFPSVLPSFRMEP